jgi:thymidylate kinase
MLVTLSGIDGSGKTSLTHLVAERLKGQSCPVKIVRPEYHANDVIKEFCRNQFGDPFAYFPAIDANIYISALVIDWLKLLNATEFDDENYVVLSDRYIYDVLAQAAHYGAELRFFLDLARCFPIPALSFFLNVPATIACARLDARKDPPKHRLESLEHLATLSRAYEVVQSQMQWKPIFLATATMQETADIVLNRILGNL